MTKDNTNMISSNTNPNNISSELICAKSGYQVPTHKKQIILFAVKIEDLHNLLHYLFVCLCQILA